VSLSVKHYHNSSWIDIPDYVIGAGDVPYISRNRDWTLRTESWSVGIAATIRNDANYSDVFEFLADDRIAVWDSAKLLFAGMVKSSPLDYESMVFNLEVISDLYKTNDYRIEYDTLHDVLVAGSPTEYEYRGRSYYLMPSVHYLYLMKKMFQVCGLTLDTSEVDDVVAFTCSWEADAYSGAHTADIKYKDLFVGESELYCINQKTDSYHTTIDSTIYDHSADKITFFDLIKELCGCLGFMIIPTGIDNYKLILETANYNIDPDNKYGYTLEQISGDEDLDNLGLTHQQVSEFNVLSVTDKTNMQSGSIGKGDGLSWLSKLKIAFISELTPFDINQTVPLVNAVWFAGGVIRCYCSSAHGLTVGNYVLIFGMAGMTQPNAGTVSGGGAGTLIVTSTPTSTEFWVSFDPQPDNYLEGGWVYKSAAGYVAGYKIGYLTPEFITPDPIVGNGLLNVLKNQVRSQSSNCTREEITCPYNTDINTVVENFIDLENRTSHIIQETY